jgi:tetratricopeptide (TPR) repeat protein
VDTRSGTHLWSQRYDRDITDIFAVQDDIAQAIVGTLKVTLTGAAPTVQASTNVDAYDAYLKGRHQLLTLTYAGVVAAQQLFETAIRIDGGFAPAHADLAGCFVHYAEQGRKSSHEAMPTARDMAKRALGLDPANPDGHHWLARVAAEYDYDWATALHHYEQATSSGRFSPSARGALAQFVLLPLGRYDEAERDAAAAIAADPLSPVTRIHLSNIYRARGALDRAAAAVDPATGRARVRLDPRRRPRLFPHRVRAVRRDARLSAAGSRRPPPVGAGDDDLQPEIPPERGRPPHARRARDSVVMTRSVVERTRERGRVRGGCPPSLAARATAGPP